MIEKDRKIDILLALFVSSMVIVNTIGSKITTILGVRISVGIFFMPILFLVTDIVGEVYGKKRAHFFIKVSAGMLIFMFMMMFLSIKMPPNPSWGMQESYALIFGSSLRMTFASIISFIISQTFDIAAFDFWKQKLKGKHLWLRNNLSTTTSQFIDTCIFMFIAFYQLTPKFTVAFLFTLIIPYWLFKVAFALLDTPLCYLGVRWLKGEKIRPSSPKKPAEELKEGNPV
ncbi:MAG: queuosine precursor transporter [Spirochaetales bacterium]|nr:queuosine precursor transporter [Spirochaetales bacterium]